MGRLGLILCTIALSLSACTGNQDPDAENSPTISRSTPSGSSQSTSRSPSDPVGNAWALLTKPLDCGPDFTVSELPSDVQAWSAVDDCRVVIAGQFGIELVTSDGAFELAGPDAEMEDVSGVALSGDTIWVSSSRPGPVDQVIVSRVSQHGTQQQPMPHDADVAMGVVATPGGVLIAVSRIDGNSARLLRFSTDGRNSAGALPSHVGMLALSPGFAVGTTAGLEPNHVFGGRLRALRTGPALSANAGGGQAAANGRQLLVGIDRVDAAGVPTRGDLYWSADAGRHWQHARPPIGITELGSIAVTRTGDRYAFMSGRQNSGVYVSTDGSVWTELQGVEFDESSPDLAMAKNGLWVLTPGTLQHISLDR